MRCSKASDAQGDSSGLLQVSPHSVDATAKGPREPPNVLSSVPVVDVKEPNEMPRKHVLHFAPSNAWKRTSPWSVPATLNVYITFIGTEERVHIEDV